MVTRKSSTKKSAPRRATTPRKRAAISTARKSTAAARRAAAAKGLSKPALRSRDDRPLFPEAGFTKEDAVEYYRSVARFLLPHLKDRPVSFLRYPGTVAEESFWEKDIPPFAPSWVRTFPVPRRSGDSVIDYVLINDLRTLVWVADIGGIELHPFLHRAPDIEHATEMVFDLDPGPGTTIIDSCRVALLLRDHLATYRLKALVKTSGSKGVQLYVPLNDEATHEMTEGFAHMIADELARRHPEQIVSKMSKSLRRGKVFIDWSQNADFKTTVAVYSLRGKRERPYVSMPLNWSEVAAAVSDGDPASLDFPPDKALQRLRDKGDLFKTLLTTRQQLPASFVSGFRKPRPERRAPERPSKDRRAAKGDIPPLPKARSQSGRRLFVLPKTELGNELWLEVEGNFRRWILRRDREKKRRLIAMPAGQFPVDPSYYRGEVQEKYKKTVTIEDIGSYERVEGSFKAEQVILFFSGKTLSGKWRLEKLEPGPEHRSWVLEPAP